MIKRSTALLLAALACSPAIAADPSASPAAAQPGRHVRHTRHRHKAEAVHPAPAVASKLPPAIAGTEPAPVPNEAVSDVPPGQAPATQVTPSLLQLHYPSVGDGYVQGSSPQAMDDRNTAKAPGVEVQVPLQQ